MLVLVVGFGFSVLFGFAYCFAGFWWCCSGFGLLVIAFGGGCVFLVCFGCFGCVWLTLCVICPKLGPDVAVIDLLDL